MEASQNIIFPYFIMQISNLWAVGWEEQTPATLPAPVWQWFIPQRQQASHWLHCQGWVSVMITLHYSSISRCSYLTPLFETWECQAPPGPRLSFVTHTTHMLHCLKLRLLCNYLRRHGLQVGGNALGLANMFIFITETNFTQRKGIPLAKYLWFSI